MIKRTSCSLHKDKSYLPAGHVGFAIVIFNLIIPAPAGCLFAQKATKDSVKTYRLNEVVVTGTRYKNEVNKIPSSITVIDQRAINQTNDIDILPVLSTRVPGLFIDSKNMAGFGVGPSAGGILTIRGIGGNPNSNVLVLIDGQPQFMGIFGHPIVDALNSSDIQKVEIIRGASSILYGTNALGGAIDIITKRPALNKPGFNVSANYGSFETSDESGSAGYRNDLFGIFASVNNVKTSGGRSDAEDGFNTTAGYLKLSLTPKGDFSFTADGDVSNSKFYDPGTIYNPTINNYYKYLRSRGSISAMNNFSIVKGALRFFYSYGDHNFYNGWHSTDEMRGITFYQNIQYYKKNVFTFGVDYKNYGGEGMQPGLPSFAARGLGIYHSANEGAVYGLINYTLLQPLNFVAGIRYTKNSLFGHDITPDFGITYSLNRTSAIKATVSKAFRSPTINELYLFPVANPNLKPEHVWNYEISYNRSLLDNYASFSITAFYDKGDNLIVVVSPFNTNMNEGSFIHKGIEFAGMYYVNENLSFSLNYSYLNCSVSALYAPKHRINFQINYNYQKFNLSANLQQVSGLYTSLQDSKTENYFLLDANINYSVTNFLDIFLKGGNLLDKNYQIDFGYPLPGRNVMLGVKFHY
jgi:iron complex outermembrane receptor protein